MSALLPLESLNPARFDTAPILKRLASASRALAELRPMKAAVEARLREIERLPQRLLAQVFDFEEETEDA